MLTPNVIGSCNHVHQYDLRDYNGRIFFVTDLHGHYELLHESLDGVGFNSERDVLFVGGDWTDRGPDSRFVMDYLDCDWIKSIQGNHEAMFVGAVDENWNGWNTATLLRNGGRWAIDLEESQVKLIYETFKSLPIGIELLLPHGRKAGIIHAEVPYNDWEKFKNISKPELEMDGLATAQWARSLYGRPGNAAQVNGVDFVLVGHTPTDSGNIEQYGNMIYCDGGSFFNHKVNFVEINDQFMRGIR